MLCRRALPAGPPELAHPVPISEVASSNKSVFYSDGELFLYACKIKETTNGGRRGPRGQTGAAFEVVTSRRFAANGEIDERKAIARVRQN